MTSPFFPGSYGSPFDDFFARYLGGEQRVPRQRVDITQFLSQQARELVNTAARQAVGTGSADLDTEHLLWAMTGDESTRAFLSRTGLDPDRLRSGLEEQMRRGEPLDEAPSLTPAAKRALLDAHRVSRALGSTYIGPEHLLFALALNPDSPGGRILREQGALGGRGEGRRLVERLTALQQAVELAAQPVGVGAAAGQEQAGGLVVRHRPQQVLGVEVRAAGGHGLPGGGVDQLAALLAEELRDVDALTGRALLATEVAGEEVVEGAPVGTGEEGGGHASRPVIGSGGRGRPGRRRSGSPLRSPYPGSRTGTARAACVLSSADGRSPLPGPAPP